MAAAGGPPLPGGVHERTVGQSQLDLGQVQADEIKVKTQAGSFWLSPSQSSGQALALMVGTRLWLAGVVGKRRDFDLIAALMAQVRALALCRPLLVAVDGFSAYVKAVRRAFRSPVPAGAVGRPRLFIWPQVVKRRTRDALLIERRIVQGCACLVHGQPRGWRHQHCLHRAPQCQLPPVLGLSGTAQSRLGTYTCQP